MTNEHALLAQWINRHDEEAFHGIVRQYSGLVYAASLRVLRNEPDAQEAALDAFLALSQLRRVPDSPLGAWLHRTAVHRAIDRYRKTRTRQRHESALARESAPEANTGIGWDDISGLVDEAVAILPEDLRRAVVGHFFEGKTHAELAEAAGLSRQAITKRVHQGVEAVRRSLIKKGVPVAGGVALTLLLTEHAVAAPAVPAALAASLGKLAVSGFTATSAAAGASLGLAAKAVIAAVVVSIVAGIGYVALPGIAKRNLAMVRAVPMSILQNELRRAFPKRKTMAGELPAPTPPTAITASSVAAETAAPPVEQGNCTVSGSLRGFAGGIAGESTIVIERTTWGPRDTPPAQTDRRVGTTDNDGNFVFEKVPAGDWSIAAWGPGGAGGNSVKFRPDITRVNVRVRVYPSTACSGVLVDEAGTPVPGAVIYPACHELTPDEEFDHLDTAASRTRTDEQGRFSFPAMIEGGMKFFVVAPGHGAQYTDYAQTGDGMRLQLRAPGRVRGRVVTQGSVGGPEGVTLRFCAGGYWHAEIRNGRAAGVMGYRLDQSVATNRSGAFALETLPEAKYRVLLPENAAWLLPVPVAVAVQSGKETSATVRLEQGCALSGRVVDAQTGEALGAGFNVTCDVENDGIRVTTDADGMYRFEALPKGERRLRIDGLLSDLLTKTEYGSLSFFNAATGGSAWTVDVKSGENHCDLAVSRARLYGRVTNSSGMPLAGVKIRGDGNPVATSGADGRFEVRYPCGSGMSLRLEAQKDGWHAADTVNLNPGGETEVNLELAWCGNGELSGVAVLSDGAPATGMILWAHTPAGAKSAPDAGERPETFSAVTTVGIDGVFKLTGLAAGAHTLSLYGTGAPYGTNETVTLRTDERRDNVRLVFAKPERHELAGVVLSEAGQPVPQCLVYFGGEGKGVASGADGKFSLSTEVSGKELELNFSAKGYTQLGGRWEMDRKDHVITLKKLRRLAGRVVNTAGAPITAYRIAVSQSVPQYRVVGSAQMAVNVNDPSGAFDFPEIFAPPATVTVTAQGYGICEQQVDGDDYGQPFVVVMRPAAAVEGTVTDTGSTPLAGCQVECGDQRSTTDDAGRFSFGNCGAGQEYSLVVRRPQDDNVVWNQIVTAPASVLCRIGQTGNIALYVKLDGAPVTDPVLARHCTAHAEFQAEDGTDARAEFVPRTSVLFGLALPAGPVRLSVRLDTLEAFGPAACEKTAEAQVEPDGQIMVEMNFETPGAPAAMPSADNALASPGATEK